MIHKRWSLARAAAVAALLLSGCDKGEPEDSGSNAAAEAGAEDPAVEDGKAEAQDPAANLPTAQSILDKAVEAVGGRDKLERVSSFHYKGQVSIMGQNMGGPIEIWWKDGDFYTTQQMTGVGEIRAGKQGDTIWSQDPINGLRRLEGAEGEQHLWASSLMLAADWKDYFTEAKTVAQREDGGKVLYDIELTSKSGAKLTMSFDKDTGLQIGQTFEQVTPMGPMPISVKMDDYRTIEPEGIRIAFRQVTDAKLMKATQEITELNVNAEVDTTKFAMPTGGAEVVRADEVGKKKDTAMPFDEDGKPGKPVPEKKK